MHRSRSASTTTSTTRERCCPPWRGLVHIPWGVGGQARWAAIPYISATVSRGAPHGGRRSLHHRWWRPRVSQGPLHVKRMRPESLRPHGLYRCVIARCAVSGKCRAARGDITIPLNSLSPALSVMSGPHRLDVPVRFVPCMPDLPESSDSDDALAARRVGASGSTSIESSSCALRDRPGPATAHVCRMEWRWGLREPGAQ
jgi:hypothetical protein